MSPLYIVDCRISKQDLYKMTLSRPFASGWIMYQFVHIRGASCRCTQSKNEHNKSKHFYSKPISTLWKIAFRMSACINYILTVKVDYSKCCLSFNILSLLICNLKKSGFQNFIFFLIHGVKPAFFKVYTLKKYGNLVFY